MPGAQVRLLPKAVVSSTLALSGVGESFSANDSVLSLRSTQNVLLYYLYNFSFLSNLNIDCSGFFPPLHVLIRNVAFWGVYISKIDPSRINYFPSRQ